MASDSGIYYHEGWMMRYFRDSRDGVYAFNGEPPANWPLVLSEIPEPTPTPERLAEIAEQEAQAAQRQQVKSDAFVQQFFAMTTPQVKARVATMTAGLPEPARELLEKLALIAHVFTKDQFK